MMFITDTGYWYRKRIRLLLKREKGGRRKEKDLLVD